MPEPHRQSRAESKRQSRLKLIDAAADAIMRHGLAGASISNILAASGLSRGMVNLHFASKERLILAVAEHFSDEYAAHWQSAIAAAGSDPRDRLAALIEADFSETVLNPRTMAVWFAFRGQAHSNHELMSYVDTREETMHRVMEQICSELAEAEGIDASLASEAILSLLEGMWSDFHLHPDAFDRDRARDIVMLVVRRLFPLAFREGV